MSLAAGVARSWAMGRGAIALDRPVIVGILNVTPDSFSDGGRFLDLGPAMEHAAALIAAGADMVDVGAESTAPGASAVAADEEWRRLAPVLNGLRRELPAVPFSVDTVKSEVARRALDAGAWAVNDVSALRLDPAIADACAAHEAGLILMHSRGGVRDMASYEQARYADVSAEVRRELAEATTVARDRGVTPERLVLDPGLGFAKTPEQSLRMLQELPALAALGFPLMVGPSRKRFLGQVTGQNVADRDRATAAACVAAYLNGAMLFRVHAPAPVKEALAVAHAVRSA